MINITTQPPRNNKYGIDDQCNLLQLCEVIDTCVAGTTPENFLLWAPFKYVRLFASFLPWQIRWPGFQWGKSGWWWGEDEGSGGSLGEKPPVPHSSGRRGSAGQHAHELKNPWHGRTVEARGRWALYQGATAVGATNNTIPTLPQTTRWADEHCCGRQLLKCCKTSAQSWEDATGYIRFLKVIFWFRNIISWILKVISCSWRLYSGSWRLYPGSWRLYPSPQKYPSSWMKFLNVQGRCLNRGQWII